MPTQHSARYWFTVTRVTYALSTTYYFSEIMAESGITLCQLVSIRKIRTGHRCWSWFLEEKWQRVSEWMCVIVAVRVPSWEHLPVCRTNSSSFLIGVRSGAQRGPRRDPNPFLSPPQSLLLQRSFWCVLWLCESYFGICSWETIGNLPPGRISIPRILALFDEILSGAANPTDAHVLPLPPPLASCSPPPHPGLPPSLHVPRILFERFITRTSSLCSPGQMSTAWQTDGRISRVSQRIFDCLLSRPQNIFIVLTLIHITAFFYFYCAFVAFLYSLFNLICYVHISILNQQMSTIVLTSRY